MAVSKSSAEASYFYDLPHLISLLAIPSIFEKKPSTL
jgi:hypothetical protein